MNKLGKKLQKKLEELANDYAGVMGIGAQALKEKTKAFLVNPDEIFCIGSQ
jgi:hypothetical protein